jgi:hypothetical protein
VLDRAAIASRGNFSGNVRVCPQIIFLVKPERDPRPVIQEASELLCKSPELAARAGAGEGFFSSGDSIVLDRAATASGGNFIGNPRVCPQVIFLVKPEREEGPVIQEAAELFCKSQELAARAGVGEGLLSSGESIVLDGAAIASGGNFIGNVRVCPQVIFLVKPEREEGPVVDGVSDIL